MSKNSIFNLTLIVKVMKTAYNIYYKGKKINNRVLTETEVRNICNKDYIYKRNTVTNELDKIPTKSLEKIKCIII